MPAKPTTRRRLKSLAQLISGVALVALVGLLARFLMARPATPGWITIHPPRDVNALVIYQDQLWSGGKDGLYQIDLESGVVLQKLTPASGPDFSFTTSLVLTPDEKQLWIGHQGGVSSFDGTSWEHYTEEQGLPDNQVLALLYHPGRGMWVATTRGLVELDPETGQISLPPFKQTRGAFSVLYLDSQDVLYAGNGYSKEGGLLSYDGENWQEITPEDGLAHPMVNAILETDDGKLYFGTGFSNQGGLTIKSGESWASIAKEDGLAGNKVRYLFQDQNGTLWVGSEFEGIAVQGQEWTVLTPQEGLAGWEVKAMLQDQAGRLWLGTENGLSRVDQDTWWEIISGTSPETGN